ncbi:hypothetical protein V1477_019787 [Vespula maculifrons]|uniref:Uncharacterized protein n=2 Tax=Vespula TaxID=7451 RepID=A0A834J3P9_VESVU|nr:hypothetical protein HZH66_014311 [Vespula vulgaris]
MTSGTERSEISKTRRDKEIWDATWMQVRRTWSSVATKRVAGSRADCAISKERRNGALWLRLLREGDANRRPEERRKGEKRTRSFGDRPQTDLRRRDRLPEEKVRRSGTDINTKATERFDLRPAGNAPSKISKSISVSSVLQAEPRIIAV